MISDQIDRKNKEMLGLKGWLTVGACLYSAVIFIGVIRFSGKPENANYDSYDYIVMMLLSPLFIAHRMGTWLRGNWYWCLTDLMPRILQWIQTKSISLFRAIWNMFDFIVIAPIRFVVNTLTAIRDWIARPLHKNLEIAEGFGFTPLKMRHVGFVAAALSGGSIGLWVHDKRVCKRLADEVIQLEAMHNDAATRAATASEEDHFSVRHSEKRIFELVCGEVQWNIDQRKQYINAGIPLLRSLLPPCKLENIMAHVLWKVAVDDDGDFYDSYLDFYARHSPNSMGSILYQGMRKCQ